MPSDLDLHGVWVPLITPFDASGAVDVEAIERLCDEYLADGVAGIVALGTTGEAPALDADEKHAVIDACSRVCAARGAPLIVGTGTNNTRSTIAATQALEGIPAVVGALVVVPYYVRPSEAAIVEHYRVVAEASPVPVVAYNIPIRTGRGLGRRVAARAGRIPNVAGVKQAVGAHRRRHARGARGRARRLQRARRRRLPSRSRMVCLGAVGAITASAHVCTARFVAMIECGLAGKLDDGRAHAEALLPVVQAGVRRAEPRGLQGRAARAGPHRDARRPHAARERVGGRDRALPRRRSRTPRTELPSR